MRIPLPKIMRHWREQAHDKRITPPLQRYGIEAWAWLAQRPWLYRLATRLGIGLLGALGKQKGRFASLPLANGWTAARDFPAPQGDTFMSQWQKRQSVKQDGGK